MIDSTRWPSTFRKTSTSPLPTPAIANANHRAHDGSRAIPSEPVPSASRPPAHSAPSGNRASRGVTNAITMIATNDRSASSSPISPKLRPWNAWIWTTRITQMPQYWPNAQ